MKQTYYRSFILLIVVPLVLVFLIAEAVIGYIVRNSAIETIDAFQENVASALSNDVRTNSLQLSHFVIVSDGEFTQTAVDAYTHSGSEGYTANLALQRAFQEAMVPSQDILVGAFYMKPYGCVTMKDEIALEEDEVRASDWFLRASQNRNSVQIDGYDTGTVQLTSSVQRANQLVIVTAMGLDNTTDKSGKIEVASFFTMSQVGDLISSQHRADPKQVSVILDENGQVLYGAMGNETICNFFAQRPGEFISGSQTRRVRLLEEGKRDYFFRCRAIPDTKWTVVTFQEESRLGQRFYEVGGMLALVVVLLMGLFYRYSRYFLNAIITPITTVCQGMEQLDRGDLEVYLEPTGQKEIQNLMTSFNQMVLSIKHMIAVAEQTEKKKHEAEIQALQSQINPHFIVNTLSSIRFMAQVAKFDGIRKMAEALVNIVSCSFRSSTSFYTVRDELEMLKTYVYLMRIRYSNGFDVGYDVREDCMDYMLPRLTLQPVVENAITHGFDELDEEMGQIDISIFRDETYLCMSVWDNGKGIDQDKMESLIQGRIRRHDDNTSIGLENVVTRLRLHFGDAVKIEIDSTPDEFTRITLKLPLNQCRKEEHHDTDTDRRR